MEFINRIGRVFIAFLRAVGRFAIFGSKAVYSCFTPPFYLKAIGSQMIEIGFYSLPVVALTTLFSGLVIALQSYAGFTKFSAEGAVAMVVELSVTRELAPVMAGLMVAGRIGAAMAAELGTMRVTEQIDAFYTLATNPYKYLVAPRIWGAVLMLPVLVFIGDIIGIYGGYLVCVYKLGFNPATYIVNTWESFQYMDIVSGMVKVAVFGLIIAMMGCYNGYHSKGGAQGVGAAATNAVVTASILILIANYLKKLLWSLKGKGLSKKLLQLLILM